MKTSLLCIPLLGLALLGSGCASMFSSGRNTVKSPWHSFDDAKAAFDDIEPGVTTPEQLHELGFDPYTNANVRILTYLDIMNQFLPNNAIRFHDLPPPVQDCLRSREKAQGYELTVTVTRNKRYGNLFLDMFAFNRKNHETGWNFKALVLMNDGKVVYKLWSGQPHVDKYDQKKKPLGPLQELDEAIGIKIMR